MNELNGGLTNWIPLSQIRIFFNYKPTQLAQLLKDTSLVVAKVGKRKFVRADSLNKFLENKSI